MSATINFLLALCILGSCGQKPESGDPAPQTVSVSPETVSIAARGGEAKVSVKASEGFEAYTRESWISAVSPEYSPASSGEVTFTVAANKEDKEREGSVAVKCGTTRKNVTEKQEAAAVPDIPTPEGYELVWQDEFDGTAVNTANWRFENWAPGRVPNEVSSSIHTKKYNHTINTQKTAKYTLAGAESGFHTYALEWTPDFIQTFVDGKLLLRFPNDGKKDRETWPFDKSFFIILNQAWGGSWGGMKGVEEGALPTTMRIDYIRVFQKKK